MTQIKEQNKTPEQDLNKMEIKAIYHMLSSKHWLLGMLEELVGYFNSIKKDPGRNEDYTK